MRFALVLFSDERSWNALSDNDKRANIEANTEFAHSLAAAGVAVLSEAMSGPEEAITISIPAGGGVQMAIGGAGARWIAGLHIIECADRHAAMSWARQVPLLPGEGVQVLPIVASHSRPGQPDR